MEARPSVDAVLVRAAAAVELLRHDPAVDGALLLSYAVWPTICLEKVPARYTHRRVRDGELDQMRALQDAGLSNVQIAARHGRAPSTVGQALRRAAR